MVAIQVAIAYGFVGNRRTILAKEGLGFRTIGFVGSIVALCLTAATTRVWDGVSIGAREEKGGVTGAFVTPIVTIEMPIADPVGWNASAIVAAEGVAGLLALVVLSRVIRGFLIEKALRGRGPAAAEQ